MLNKYKALLRLSIWKKIRLVKDIRREWVIRRYGPPHEQVKFYMRTIDINTRQIYNREYSSMKEIVEYVFYNIPDTKDRVYLLVKENLDTKQEHILQLKHNTQKLWED